MKQHSRHLPVTTYTLFTPMVKMHGVWWSNKIRKYCPITIPQCIKLTIPFLIFTVHSNLKERKDTEQRSMMLTFLGYFARYTAVSYGFIFIEIIFFFIFSYLLIIGNPLTKKKICFTVVALYQKWIIGMHYSIEFTLYKT